MREKFVEEGLLEILMEFVKNNLPAPRPLQNQVENVESNENNNGKPKKKSLEKVEQEVFTEKSPAEKRLEENQWLIPHCLFIIHKLLMIPEAVEKFVELCGIQLMLDLLDESRYEMKTIDNDKKPDKKEDKTDKKKQLSRAASKLKKNKEEDTIEEKDNKDEEERENSLLEQVHIVTTVADCLSLALAPGTFFESIRCQNIEERYFNFLLATTPTLIPLPLEPSIAYQASIISFLAVLAINPASKSIIAQHEGLNAILNKCSTDDFDLAHAISLLLANLVNCNQPNCILLTEKENLERLLQLFENGHEFTLVNVTQLITTLALHPLPRANLTVAPVVRCIMDLLARQLKKSDVESSTPEIKLSSNHNDFEKKFPFIESDILIRSCLMALQGLCVDFEGRQLMKEEDLSIFLGLLECHCVEVQTESALLLHHLSHHPDIGQDFCQLGYLRIAFRCDISAGGCNQAFKLLLDQLFKYNLIAKLAYQGFLGDEDKIQDGFIDVGRMKKDDWIEMTDISAFLPLQDPSQRPVYLINPVAKVPPSNADEDDEEEEKEKQDLKIPSKKINKKKSENKLDKKPSEKVLDAEASNSVLSHSSQQQLLFDKEVFYDVSLYEFIEDCLKNIFPLPTTKHQVEALAKVVSERLGGQVFKENLKNFEWEEHIREFMVNNESGIVPIGALKWGIHHHRALLFKTLADRLLIPCSLITCDYGRSFILVTMMQPTNYIDMNCKKKEQLVAVRFVVDLIYQPGLLIPHPSKKARAYYSF